MKLFVFDFDGTLVNSEIFFKECMDYALEPFDVEMNSEMIENIRHLHPHELFHHIIGPENGKVAVQRLQKAGKQIYKKIKPFEGIEDVLAELQTKDCGVAIWTGRDGASTGRILQETKLDRFFDKYVSGTCVAQNKPAHDGLHFMTRHFDINHDEMVVIGDHHHDILPANELGCTSVHARWKEAPNCIKKHCEADHSFEQTDHLLNWIKELDFSLGL